MIDLKPTAGRLREHWRYGWWKYLLFTVLALVGVNLLYTATKPKIPYNQKVEVLSINPYMSDDVVKQWESDLKGYLFGEQMDTLNKLLSDKTAQQTETRAKINDAKTEPEKSSLNETNKSLTTEIADIKAQINFINQYEVSISNTTLMEGQEINMLQLMAARMAGQEGTVMLLPQSMFHSMALGGGFIDLKDVLPQLDVPQGTDLTKGQVIVGADQETGEKGALQQVGIPLDQCKGLSQFFVNSDMVLCFPVYAEGNWDNALKAANWLLNKTEETIIADNDSAQPQATVAGN